MTDSEADLVTQAVFAQLSALDALATGTGTVWLEADQVRYLRVFIEEGIDELARADDERYRFTAECAMLAGENMQDARLLAIEKRLEPQGETFADFLLNLGLMLALELLLVAGANIGIPAVIAFAATRAQFIGARRLAQKMKIEQLAARDTVLALTHEVMERRAARKAMRVTDPGEFWENELVLRQAEAELRRAEDALSLAQTALEWNEALVTTATAALNTVDTEKARELKSASLRKFLHGAVEESALARMAENSAASMVQQIIGAPSGNSSRSPFFKTSTIVGRFLAESREQRNDAAREWSLLKRHVRSLGDEQFLDSELVRDAYLKIHSLPGAAAVDEIVAKNRDPIVKGFEGVLWLSWLHQQDALGAREVRDFPLVSLNPLDPVREGGVTDDILVTYRTRPPAPADSVYEGSVYMVDGVRYSGLSKISDQQAEYLYSEFAADFFTSNPDSAPAPMQFTPGRYAEVAAMPRTSYGVTNYDRLDRLSEMKLLAIEFFRIFLQNPSAIGGEDGSEAREMIRTLLDIAPEADPIGDYLATLPPISMPPEPEPDPSIGPVESQEGSADDALTRLRAMVTDLDLMITQFPQESLDESPANAAARADADDLSRAIRDAQDAVQAQFDATLELAAGVTRIVDELRSLEPRIARLRDWPPPAWRWYGPPQADSSASRSLS